MKKEFRTKPKVGLCSTICAALIIFLECSSTYSAARSMEFPGDFSYKQFVIYGDDNRKDYYEVTSENWRARMDSSAMLVPAGALKRKSNGQLELVAQKFRDQKMHTQIGAVPFCQTERFLDQKTPGFCSGALVGPQTIITAGHCVDSFGPIQGGAAADAFVVFGQNIKVQGSSDPGLVNMDQVYGVKKVIASNDGYGESDYAILLLDRPVTVAKPVPVEQSTAISKLDELTLIGSPWGLPVKLAEGAKIREITQSTIEASTDSYAANSGSAVYN